MKRPLSRVCVFCSARWGARPEYAATAQRLGQTLAARGLVLVYGGGSKGLMGVVADAALQAGGQVIGVMPQSLVDREFAHQGLTELHIVQTMAERKTMLGELSDAFVSLPGGFGTLDEFSEMVTLASDHQKPSALLNVADFYTPLVALLDRMVRERFAEKAYRRGVIVETDPERLLAALAAFDPDEIAVVRRPPMILVTGATDGIGRTLASELAIEGADVIIHGRDEKKLAAVHREVEAAAGRPMPEPELADFTSLSAVRQMAARLIARPYRPTILINNAGVFMNERRLSIDGFEQTMAINHLAPFLLTHLLLDDPGCALTRIVNVGSLAQSKGLVDPADVGLVARPFDGFLHYSSSKLANLMTMRALAKRLRSRRISVTTIHPGIVPTKLRLAGFKTGGDDTLQDAAAHIRRLALGPEVTDTYFIQSKESPMAKSAEDSVLVETFYAASAEAVGVAPLGVT